MTSPDATPRRTPRFVFLLVAAYAAAILLPFLGSGRTLTTHEVLVSLKRALDPHGVLNPGKLGLPDPFGPVDWP